MNQKVCEVHLGCQIHSVDQFLVTKSIHVYIKDNPGNLAKNNPHQKHTNYFNIHYTLVKRPPTKCKWLSDFLCQAIITLL